MSGSHNTNLIHFLRQLNQPLHTDAWCLTVLTSLSSKRTITLHHCYCDQVKSHDWDLIPPQRLVQLLLKGWSMSYLRGLCQWGMELMKNPLTSHLLKGKTFKLIHKNWLQLAGTEYLKLCEHCEKLSKVTHEVCVFK